MLKDRLRRVEMFGALGVHPGEDMINRPFRTVVLDCERMTTVDARSVRGCVDRCAHSAACWRGSPGERY